WRNQFDTVRRKSQALRNFLRDGGGDGRLAGRIAFPRLRYDHQFFRAAAGMFFDFVGIKIAAAFDDDVLHAAGDEDFSLRAVATVAGIQPGEFVVARWTEWKEFFRCRGIIVI